MYLYKPQEPGSGNEVTQPPPSAHAPPPPPPTGQEQQLKEQVAIVVPLYCLARPGGGGGGGSGAIAGGNAAVVAGAPPSSPPLVYTRYVFPGTEGVRVNVCMHVCELRACDMVWYQGIVSYQSQVLLFIFLRCHIDI